MLTKTEILNKIAEYAIKSIGEKKENQSYYFYFLQMYNAVNKVEELIKSIELLQEPLHGKKLIDIDDKEINEIAPMLREIEEEIIGTELGSYVAKIEETTHDMLIWKISVIDYKFQIGCICNEIYSLINDKTFQEEKKQKILNLTKSILSVVNK